MLLIRVDYPELNDQNKLTGTFVVSDVVSALVRLYRDMSPYWQSCLLLKS